MSLGIHRGVGGTGKSIS